MASKRMDVVRIAQQYVGCKRGSAKHKDLVDTFNSVKPHGEKGNYTCAWCAITWTAIQIKAGNDQSVAPYSYNCGTLITYAKKINAWVENDAFVPSPGDGIIYYWGDTGKGDCGVDNGVGCASHVGVVETVSGGYITVIEGNKGTTNACGRRRIKVNSRYIRGFITPHYADGTTEYDYTLVEDGDWGFATTLTTQHILGCTEDGEMGPNTIKAIQNKVGATADGEWGPNTTKAMQKFLSVTVDGERGPITTKAWQHWCNEQLSPTPPSGKKYTGELPSLEMKMSSQDVINSSLAWGKNIVNDNTFHYGEGGRKSQKGTTKYNITHRCGCYFCGTNYKKKVVPANKAGLKGSNWYKTYVCCTFVTAMLAHGGHIASIMNTCKKSGSLSIGTETGKCSQLEKSSDWKKLGHPSYSNLAAGDVLVSKTHMSMVYAPVSSKKVSIIEATSYDGNYGSKASNNSIRIITKAPSFVSAYRYIGSINRSIDIEYGEFSNRVKLVQSYLNWAFEGTANWNPLVVDGDFQDATLAAIKAFQTKVGITVDGIVGSGTLEAMKNFTK